MRRMLCKTEQMETQHHVRKYMDYHEKYTKKYGENTVVLMQAGSHFNLFAVINDEVNIESRYLSYLSECFKQCPSGYKTE